MYKYLYFIHEEAKKKKEKNPSKPNTFSHFLSSVKEHCVNVDGILYYGIINSNWETISVDKNLYQIKTSQCPWVFLMWPE